MGSSNVSTPSTTLELLRRIDVLFQNALEPSTSSSQMLSENQTYIQHRVRATLFMFTLVSQLWFIRTVDQLRVAFTADGMEIQTVRAHSRPKHII